MSPRVLWNNLVPWRRRRRYYFLQILTRLHQLEVERSKWPGIFEVSPEQFADFETGETLPRLFIQSLAIMGYKIPAPDRAYINGPVVALTGLLGLVVLAFLEVFLLH